jgi:hypothetical protein
MASQHSSMTFLHKTLDIGFPVLSRHLQDNSYFFNGTPLSSSGNWERNYKDYQEIDLETFLQITGMSKYTVTREQFKQGYELACFEWKEKLMEQVGKNLILSDETSVSMELVIEMSRALSNLEQKEFFNTLFPSVNKIRSEQLEIGEAMKITDNGQYNGIILLKAYSGFVDVFNPGNTWNECSFSGVRVYLKITYDEL